MARIPDYRFHERLYKPAAMDKFAAEDAPWHETPEEKRDGLREGKRRQKIVAGIRKIMDRKLTEKQRFCVNEYFFEAKTMRLIASEQGLHHSTIAQHIKAGLNRIRKALCAV